MAHPLIEHWDGHGWHVVTGLRMEGQLAAVAASSSQDVWAAGTSQRLGPSRLLLLHWNGRRWTTVNPPKLEGTNVAVASLVAPAGDAAWLAGSQVSPGPYRVLLLRWDGRKWRNERLPRLAGGNMELSGVGTSSAKDVWAVGWRAISDDRSAPLALHFDGHTWRVVSSPNAGLLYPSSALRAVAARSPNDAWAVGNQVGAYPGYSLTLTQHWNGRRWSVVRSPTVGIDTLLTTVGVGAHADVWALGEQVEHGEAETAVLHWNGQDWRFVKACNAPEARGTGLSISPDGTVWASGWIQDGPAHMYHTSTIIQRRLPSH